MTTEYDIRNAAETSRQIVSGLSGIGVGIILSSAAKAFIPYGGGLLGVLEKICVNTAIYQLSTMAMDAVYDSLNNAGDVYVKVFDYMEKSRKGKASEFGA